MSFFFRNRAYQPVELNLSIGIALIFKQPRTLPLLFLRYSVLGLSLLGVLAKKIFCLQNYWGTAAHLHYTNYIILPPYGWGALGFPKHKFLPKFLITLFYTNTNNFRNSAKYSPQKILPWKFLQYLYCAYYWYSKLCYCLFIL